MENSSKQQQQGGAPTVPFTPVQALRRTTATSSAKTSAANSSIGKSSTNPSSEAVKMRKRVLSRSQETPAGETTNSNITPDVSTPSLKPSTSSNVNTTSKRKVDFDDEVLDNDKDEKRRKYDTSKSMEGLTPTLEDFIQLLTTIFRYSIPSEEIKTSRLIAICATINIPTGRAEMNDVRNFRNEKIYTKAEVMEFIRVLDADNKVMLSASGETVYGI